MKSLVIAVLSLSAAPIASLAGDGPCLDWERLDPPVVPPPRYGGAMVYDAARDVVLLYGGAATNTQYLGDLWQWDGETWTEIVQPEMNPGERSSARMVFDESTGKVLLYSGLVRSMYGTYAIGDIWSWDGAVWTREWLNTTNEFRGRVSCALVFDPVREALVVHGGVIVGTDYQGVMRSVIERADDVWTTSDTGVGVSPGYVSGHAAWFDPATQRTLVIGQNGFPTSEFCEFWSWDGDMWTRIDVPTPLSRNGAISGYDPVRGWFLLSGGRYDGVTYRETWAWDGEAWSLLNTSPTPVRNTAFCVDGDGRLITFGGLSIDSPPVTPPNSPAIDEMWRLGPAPLDGDTDGDAAVGMSDLMAVVEAINTAGEDLPADVDDDGDIDFADLNIVVSNYNQTCP